ncbi:LysR family transcriptional regulator [Micromonospora sp. STR1s_6]|uniref:LysR family transcriptional regulator n=1 Tax=Micromonospora tarensis TaxID=2806100 RepID=A0ABS1YMF4_9ACTN|nr:LysR family transcriptional regulator [Micromonospora tarensis]MBM0278617.1 LysR family transcriptional regulator [Micromonospora tarensis]
MIEFLWWVSSGGRTGVPASRPPHDRARRSARTANTLFLAWLQSVAVATPELRQLRYFLVLAEELSYSRAAARLMIAQQSLSQQITALERVLGVRLFDRDSRGTTLTDIGALFVPEARAVTDRAEQAVAVVRRACGRGRHPPARLPDHRRQPPPAPGGPGGPPPPARPASGHRDHHHRAPGPGRPRRQFDAAFTRTRSLRAWSPGD